MKQLTSATLLVRAILVRSIKTLGVSQARRFRIATGAVYGMEKMMGRTDNPLRSILHWSSEKFLEKELDLWYILTVIGRDGEKGNTVIRGLFIGNDIQCYQKACELSLKVNFTLVEKPLRRVVTYLNPDEFHSTWLGNKSIYRTRMAMADGGELIVLAPGLERFGEDDAVDRLIRTYGYVGTPTIMDFMREHEELQDNLSAVAHLIHVSVFVLWCVAIWFDFSSVTRDPRKDGSKSRTVLESCLRKKSRA